MITKKNIIIATGGTGGHVISGICISNYLIYLKNNVTWVGSKNRMESYLISDNNINIDYISILNINTKSFFDKIKFYYSLLKSIYESCKIISYRKPDIIIGMGGYISIPVCIAGWIKNIPIIIHEQNCKIGLSNKILYFISKKFLSGFNLKNKNYIYVGNPVRKNIINISKPEIRLKNRKGPIRILILGGSQGSYFINKNIPLVIKKLNNVLIWHICGKNNYNFVFDIYNKLLCYNKVYLINDFILDIYKAYYWSDLIICRSGALTISEILCVGLPSIIIPFIGKDKHQYYNSLFLDKIGVTKIFNENEFDIDLIYNYISNLDRNKLLELSIRCRKYYNFNSIENIIKEIYNLFI
ncbi:undecaprenyldiphospho-muramoylpentapeptide beta-N-acetylglucosaminyltransferase [endosymbiont of Pachyrhynchus infernalis]|uniref:undecaprenyldiphospho-muramoylpentapeptide beta-N-acetylglucosaminyltransferase n=1 Tax=endosymbiont of Pachyrhynchus infernalis TaxID=1971488 RepID=UPI000DC6D8CC|nr:undecaprenyldiphospho-muramoylpentapeptide beta-N-acetylglucosaminyltransferase [endosymbiont of Pachyrhynchus infernalis]BBA84766.1 UDP-N-acetylglucosamine--N-acetylmuramyl-(pentapeptide) pyrophosphoryl-undecaprenol N-acetylglucosamine transferase [endosymbiont of Pachyrhynchus infernalis]